ncbi:MAG TPA: cysteine desulfurase family protein [Acidimicrobiia bacterium]|nr:cysteine desulfurase family protein [Acidimicrobiia bacterium]
MIYLDHAATTPMGPGVWDAMRPFSEEVFGNSSGIHETSRRAKNALEEARERIAATIGARPLEIVLTSGGTESDNLALKGSALSPGPRRGVVTLTTEHEAVLESADYLRRLQFPTAVVGVDESGAVDVEALLDAIDPETAVVSVMHVNNETGVVQDLAGLVAAVKGRDPGVLFHSDAVQAFASEMIDVDELGVDLLTITGHKFGGPKGAGLLYVREGTPLEPVLHGGGQELGRRSGTHDVAGAVGLATAMEAAAGDRARFRSQVGQIRDDFEKRMLAGVDDLVVNTPDTGRSPQHLNLRFPGVRNETLLVRLDRAQVAASAGSACQSGASEVSHVLEGMGLSADQARESVRFSFGWNSTPDEAIEASDIVLGLIEELR